MERMALISHGFHIVVQPTYRGSNEARVHWGNIEIGLLTDDPRQGMGDMRCLHDARYESRAFGRQDQRIGVLVDRLVAHLQKLAADRHTPPTLETVEAEDDE